MGIARSTFYYKGKVKVLDEIEARLTSRIALKPYAWIFPDMVIAGLQGSLSVKDGP